MEPSVKTLTLLDTSAGGSGGCGCCGTPTSTDASDRPTSSTGIDMTTQTYSVTGMTCGHCEQAVADELRALGGVTDVAVDLVAGGTSSVTVISAEPLDEAQVVAALEEAGDYQLA